MNLLPKFGWFDLPRDEALRLDLNINYQWEGWGVEWFGYAFLFIVRVKKDDELYP